MDNNVRIVVEGKEVQSWNFEEKEVASLIDTIEGCGAPLSPLRQKVGTLWIQFVGDCLLLFSIASNMEYNVDEGGDRDWIELNP